jgi:hypothetical protein
MNPRNPAPGHRPHPALGVYCCWLEAMWQGQDSNLCRQCRRFYRSQRRSPRVPSHPHWSRSSLVTCANGLPTAAGVTWRPRPCRPRPARPRVGRREVGGKPGRHLTQSSTPTSSPRWLVLQSSRSNFAGRIDASGPPERPGNTTHTGCTPWRRGSWARPSNGPEGPRRRDSYMPTPTLCGWTGERRC